MVPQRRMPTKQLTKVSQVITTRLFDAQEGEHQVKLQLAPSTLNNEWVTDLSKLFEMWRFSKVVVSYHRTAPLISAGGPLSVCWVTDADAAIPTRAQMSTYNCKKEGTMGQSCSLTIPGGKLSGGKPWRYTTVTSTNPQNVYSGAIMISTNSSTSAPGYWTLTVHLDLQQRRVPGAEAKSSLPFVPLTSQIKYGTKQVGGIAQSTSSYIFPVLYTTPGDQQQINDAKLEIMDDGKIKLTSDGVFSLEFQGDIGAAYNGSTTPMPQLNAIAYLAHNDSKNNYVDHAESLDTTTSNSNAAGYNSGTNSAKGIFTALKDDIVELSAAFEQVQGGTGDWSARIINPLFKVVQLAELVPSLVSQEKEKRKMNQMVWAAQEAVKPGSSAPAIFRKRCDPFGLYKESKEGASVTSTSSATPPKVFKSPTPHLTSTGRGGFRGWIPVGDGGTGVAEK